MRASPPHPGHDDLWSSSAAYALDALSPDERELFERQLALSPALRSEVRAFVEVATELALAARPVTPTAPLKATIERALS